MLFEELDPIETAIMAVGIISVVVLNSTLVMIWVKIRKRDVVIKMAWYNLLFADRVLNKAKAIISSSGTPLLLVYQLKRLLRIYRISTILIMFSVLAMMVYWFYPETKGFWQEILSPGKL